MLPAIPKGRKSVAVDGVGQKQAAEEKNFSDQKDPHAKGGGFFLLVQRLKVSVQLSGAMHSVLLFSACLDFPSYRRP